MLYSYRLHQLFYALVWPDWMRFYPLGFLCRLPIYCNHKFNPKSHQIKDSGTSSLLGLPLIYVLLQQKHTYSVYNINCTKYTKLYMYIVHSQFTCAKKTTYFMAVYVWQRVYRPCYTSKFNEQSTEMMYKCLTFYVLTHSQVYHFTFFVWTYKLTYMKICLSRTMYLCVRLCVQLLQP